MLKTCPRFRDVKVWKGSAHLRIDEIQLEILAHRVLWGSDGLIWVGLSEQSLAQSKYIMMFYQSFSSTP